MNTPIEFQPKDFPLHKPYTEDGLSDFYVIGTDDGDMDIALYNKNTGLWYSQTDPTGFGNVKWFARFDRPDDFDFNDVLNRMYNGGVDET